MKERFVRGVSIYKPARRNRRTDPYLMAFTENGKRKTETGSTSLNLTVRKANEIGLRLEAIKLRLVDPHSSKYAKNEVKPINKHLDDYEKHIVAQGHSEGYAGETVSICRRVVDAAGVSRLSEIVESEIQSAIFNLKPSRKIAYKTLSLRQRDKAVRAMKSFCHWLKKDKRVAIHLLADLTHYDPEQDRRRIRRVESQLKLISLIETTRKAKFLGGMTGAERSVMYATAIGTGFRFSTLGKIKPEDFEFTGIPAIIWVEAQNTKGRKRYEHPLRDDLAAMIKKFLMGRENGKPIFTPGAHFNETFQKDCRAVEIVEKDASGHVFDVHSMRNQYITEVVRAAGLAVAQDLAHHSTPVLTKKYARLSFPDYDKALAALPKLTSQKPTRKEGVA